MGSRLTVKQMLLNEIDKQPRGYAEVLANVTRCYSSGSNLKKALKKEIGEFEEFSDLIALIKYQFGADDKKLMAQYSTEMDVKKENARCMLEYLSCNRMLESMKQLIDNMLECSNATSRDYAKVYKLQYEWQSNYYNLDHTLFLKKVNETKTSVSELNVFLYLLKFYGYYRQQNYKLAYEISKLVINEIEEIEDKYIKCMYKTKLNEALSYIQLRVLNKPEESRKCSEEVIVANIGITFDSYAHYSIGTSYIFTSYDKSIYHFEESINLYQSINRNDVVKDVKEKIELLNVIWGKESEFYYLNSKLLYEAKNGKLKDADLEKFKDKLDLSFYLLIKGIKDNNNDVLLQSLIEFLKIGDTFLGNIPKIELLNKNYNQDVLNSLISLNYA